MEELLAEFGSLLVELTVAVLLALTAELNVDALTLIAIVASPPAPIVPRLQVTVPAACEQVPCVVDTEAKVTCAGSGSLTVTPRAVAGPLLLTCKV